MGDDKSQWDRPWSLKEMRDSANNWSLACDAGMLQHLQEFSQRMIARTHEIQQQVQGLVHETELSHVRVQSAFNDFIMLANTQFVENRVYDEDVTAASQESEKKEEKEKTKEEREAELIPKITQAVKLGLSVMESAFERLDTGPGSDSEDEATPEPILEAKDPYIQRALPYLIGSQAFLQDDDVGLIDMLSDEEVGGAESESETSELSESEKQGAPPAQRQLIDKFDSETDSEDEDLFDDKKKFSEEEEEEESQSEEESEASGSGDEEQAPASQNAAPRDFASELASKLGIPAQQPVKQPDSNEVKKKSRKERTSKIAVKENGATDSNDDDLFATSSAKATRPPPGSGGGLFDREPPEDDLFADDDGFGGGGGLFGTGKKVSSLFDDDEEEGGLFDDKPAPKVSTATKRQPASEPVAKQEPASVTPQESTTRAKQADTRKKKKPAGGISIFGDDGDDVDWLSDKLPTPATTGGAPARKAPSLFDEQDEQDLFSPTPLTSVAKKPATQTQAAPTKQAPALFGGSVEEGSEESEDDLFAAPTKPRTAAAPTTATTADVESTPTAATGGSEQAVQQPKKKLPPGAVSMFGGAQNPLVAALRANQRPQQTDSDEQESDWSDDGAPQPSAVQSRTQEPAPVPVKSSPVLQRGEKTSEIPTQPVASREPSKKAAATSGLFGDSEESQEEEDDLFSAAKRAQPKPSTAAKAPSTKATAAASAAVSTPLGAHRSDDSDEDLFSTAPRQQTSAAAKPSPLFGDASPQGENEDKEDLFAASVAKETSSKRKPVGGVALFGGADLFGEGPLSSWRTPRQDEDIQHTNKQDTVPTAQTVPPQATSVTSASVAPSQQTTKKGAKSTPSLFDADSEEEEDLFAALTSKNKKPAAREGPSLFSDTDDLFAPVKPAPVPVQPTATEESKSQSIESESQPPQKMFPQEAEPARPRKSAGAVSMFGGLDPAQLIRKQGASQAQEPTIPGTSQVQNATTQRASKPPPSAKKPETSKTITAVKDPLFGDGSSDEEDLLSSSSKSVPKQQNGSAKVDLAGVTETASTTDQPDPFHTSDAAEQPEAEPARPRKLAGAVSMFGGLDPAQLVRSKQGTSPAQHTTTQGTSPAQRATTQETSPAEQKTKDRLLGEGASDEEDDLFSSAVAARKSAPPAKVTTAPRLPSPGDAPSTSTPAAKHSGATASIAALQSSLALEPARLLPGATPPVRDTPGVAADFDSPASAAPLPSIAKDRAKMQRGRRLPSRKSRTERLRKSQASVGMNDSLTSQPELSIQGEGENELSGKQKKKNKVDKQKAEPSKPMVQSRDKRRDLFGNDDLFSDDNNTLISSTKTQIVDMVPKSTEQSHDDIFGTVDVKPSCSHIEGPLSQTPNTTKSSSNENMPTLDRNVAPLEPNKLSSKPQSEQVGVDPLQTPIPVSTEENEGDDGDEDIFNSAVSSRSQLSASSVPSTTDSLSEDLFGSKQQSKTSRTVFSPPPPLKISSVDGASESEDEDLFASALQDHEKDEELFGASSKTGSQRQGAQVENETDRKIKGETESKPLSVEQSSIKPNVLNDDEDDIFANSSVLQGCRATRTQSKPGDIFASTAADVSISQLPTNPVTAASISDPLSMASVAGFDPNDIFASAKGQTEAKREAGPQEQTEDIFITKRVEMKDIKDEDIFASAHNAPSVPRASGASGGGGARARRRVKHVTPDEKIFQDDTDIFADLPAARPKTVDAATSGSGKGGAKKGKKTGAQTGAQAGKPLFSTPDTDDIFATLSSTSSQPKASSTKTTKKKEEKKDSKMTPDVSDIFSDPLNALK